MADTVSLENALSDAASFVREKDNFAIVSHYDADGLCAAAILAKALERENKHYEIKIVKQLYAETMEEIKGMGNNYIFSDFGSSQIGIIKQNFSDFLILDHHQPATQEYEPLHINPFFFSVNGGNEISGAGMCYLFAEKLNPLNRDLSALAVVGAVGDMQDFSGRLLGMNRRILDDAVSSGLLDVSEDLRLYGRISRPLVQFLEFSGSPSLPGLTADEKACTKFISGLGIPLKGPDNSWRAYSGLSAEEKRIFTTSLILHLREKNVPERRVRSFIGEVYTLLQEDEKSPLRDAKEFATLCNSCGRHGRGEVALSVCMGDRSKAYSDALSLLTEHRKQLRQGISYIKEKGIEEKENFYFFDAGSEVKESIVGIIAGMLYGSGLLSETKPVFAMATNEDGSLKVSARATKALVERGLNLGALLKGICAEMSDSSEGGGHSIAAGCRIKPEERGKFLSILGDRIKEQLA
jgi:RecJ-like exonuclease